MGIVSVTYSCGHNGGLEVSSRMSSSQKQEKREWAENQGLCSACYAQEMQAKKEAERAKQTQAAAEATADMPSLEGSEKQIAFATTMRAEKIKWVRHTKKQCIDAGKDAWVKFFEKMESITSAKFWIEVETDGSIQMQKMVKQYSK